MNSTERLPNGIWIAAGLTLWLPLLLTFLSGLRLAQLPHALGADVVMIAALVVATLLLGVLIGRGATVSSE